MIAIQERCRISGTAPVFGWICLMIVFLTADFLAAAFAVWYIGS